MRAKKKATRTPGSVRYLLSADRRLQKLSLRKISGGERKAAKAQPQSARSKTVTASKSGAVQKPIVAVKPAIPPPPKGYNWRVVVVAATCVMAAAALMTARQPTDEGEPADAPHAQRAAIVAPEATPQPSNTSKSAAPKPAPIAASKAVTTAAPATTATPKPASSVAPKPVMTKPAAPLVPQSADTPTARTQPVESRNGDAAADPMPKAERAGPAIVTITGCVQRDGETFWMKDTSGADAPKSRSWKTGFFRKRPTRVGLVDAGGTLTLASYVGERVAAVGTLVDREMRARSLRRIAVSCD